MSNWIEITAHTYHELGSFNKESQLFRTISDFPAGSDYWLTEWIFKGTLYHLFIVGHEKRKDKETFFFRIQNKEVSDE